MLELLAGMASGAGELAKALSKFAGLARRVKKDLDESIAELKDGA